jgi:enoyl-CoA hydratase
MAERHNVLYTVADRIATITVDRPDKLNALDDETIEELGQAFEDAFVDAGVGVVVLTGSGDKAFVAGADIQMLVEQGVLDGKANSLLGQDLMDLIETGPKAVIAAVNGYALGGGLELALACDFRYASSKAQLGLPEVGLGIIPGYGGTQRLPRLIGAGPGLELILTGGRIDAAEALRLRLVNKVFPPEQLLDETRKAARQILAMGPVAVRLAKEAVRRGLQLSLAEGLKLEADLFGMISSTEDMREGLQAFLAKRKPAFRGA